jgi:hypothetical protein
MKTRTRRLVSILQIATALGIAVFWSAFFLWDLAPENSPECYLPFERAFPLADILLAAALLAAGVAGWKGMSVSRVLSLICAGALIFLALVDFSFNVQNGIYVSSMQDLILNGFINLWIFGFGISLILIR